jgi:hypothetical protein
MFVFIIVVVYCWRALFAGNTRSMNHGGGIANNYLPICENIFQQFDGIRLTSYQTLYFQAFPSITSHEEIPWPQGKLSTHETSKPPRCQASKRLELPIKGEGDSIKRRKEEEAKEHGKHQISIHLS